LNVEAAAAALSFKRGPATIRSMSEQLERLVHTKMPYGKHKGVAIADLPGNYLNWFAREGFPPGDIGRLLALMHEIDHNGLQHLLRPLRNPRGPAG
jgi:uncharacterized protein (DUF3820 family)